MKNWSVYIHTSPSGKTYIGITHTKPEYRWGKDGNRYSKKTVFYKAIMKYGWNNLKHEILFHNCSEELAKALEVAIIKYYTDRDLSYNTTIGGEGYNLGKESSSVEYRNSKSREFREKHPEYDKKQYELHKEAVKQRAREYYTKNREKVLSYKKSDAVKEKARIRAAKWREAHPNYMKEYMKEYNGKKKQNLDE